MVEDERATGLPANSDDAAAPGISWEPGEEDYPFPAIPGETALEYLGRWLEQADYARLERNGFRYIHETDVANVVNHITADVGLLRARLGPFGDRVVTAEAYDATIRRIEGTIAELGAVLEALRDPGG